MSEDQIAGKSAADKRKALLALAADRGGEVGPCLGPAAMTAFVTGTCSAEDKQLALRHVSLCRRCYGEWLVLAEMEMERNRGRRKAERIPFYLKPANLAALVSAMAAVICVGLFLDIDPFGYRTEPPVESTAPIQRDSELPAKQQLPPAVKKSGTENAGDSQEQPQLLPQAAIPAMIEKKHPAGPAEKARGLSPETMTAPAPASPPAQAMHRSAAPAPVATDQAAGAPVTGEADAGKEMGGPAAGTMTSAAWEEELISACRYELTTGSASANRLSLFRTGKRWLDEQQATTGTSHAPSPLLSILDQAENMEQLFARCGEILAIAGKDRR